LGATQAAAGRRNAHRLARREIDIAGIVRFDELRVLPGQRQPHWLLAYRSAAVSFSRVFHDVPTVLLNEK
jgi:hypothetical protein